MTVSTNVDGKSFQGGCRPAFIVTPACRFCVALAKRLRETHNPVQWLVLGGREVLADWIEEAPHTRNQSFALMHDDGGQPLRVPVTPVRIILTEADVVVDFSASQRVPSPVELEAACTAS